MEQQTAQEEFKSKDLTVKVIRKPRCMVEFHVQASPELVKQSYNKALKAVTKEVVIPGFRKGKAPQEMVIKKFARDIDREWEQEIANDIFPESEKLANIPILKKDAKINYKLNSHSLDKGAELTFTFETEPTIPTIDPKQFKLKPVDRPPVTDVQIEETLRQIQFFFAKWKDIEGRPVSEGDFIIMDVDIIDTDPPNRLFTNTRFEVTDKSMAKWMKPLVIGLSKGDSVEGVSMPDDDVPEKDKTAFTPKKVRLTVKEIEEVTLPALDEKYFQTLGVPNAEELRSNITRLLNEKADSHVREGERSQAVEFLINTYPFDLPPSFVLNETRFRLRQLSQDPQFNDQWQHMNESEQKNAVQAITEQSEKAVRLFYVCNRLLKDKQIKISPEDLPKPPSTPLEALIRPQPDSHFQGNDELKDAEAYSRLILEKAEDYIVAEAKGQ